ncbi:MAG: phasin family protein [Candidatus Competibacter denitrificans]
MQCSNKFAILHCSIFSLANSLSKEFPMVIDLFNKALEAPPVFAMPFTKANQLFAANLEKMVIFQMSAFQSYLDIGLNQMKAAAEITDIKSLQDFYNRQSEIAQTVQQKLMIDAKAMANMAARFKVEMDNLTRATLEDVLPKAA